MMKNIHTGRNQAEESLADIYARLVEVNMDLSEIRDVPNSRLAMAIICQALDCLRKAEWENPEI